MRVVSFVQHKLCEIGSAISPSKKVDLPPEGYVPTLEDIAFPGALVLPLRKGVP